MFRKLMAGLAIWLLAFTVHAVPVHIVAAENFYGRIGEQIGGNYAQVTSILNNPQQDPHLFSSNPATARAVADADIIIYNGLGYDSWINNLIASAQSKNSHIINASSLTGKKMGDNPHIWYDPKTMLAVANRLATQLGQLDPAHQPYFQEQLSVFTNNYQALEKKIQQLQKQYRGTAVIATEPVFNDMADALGLVMQGRGFQLSIMNDTEPAVSDVRDFENKLTQHQVKVLIFNNQVTNPATDRMQKIAQKAGIPVVGVSETEPLNQDYFSWMSNQLNALERALTSS